MGLFLNKIMTELEVFYKNTKQYLNDVVMNLITNF